MSAKVGSKKLVKGSSLKLLKIVYNKGSGASVFE